MHYEVKLFDFISQKKLKESTKWEQFKARHGLSDRFNKDSALGELFGFTVCSPAFQESPTEEYAQNTDRFLVQQKFNEDEAISYLRSRLDSIGEKAVDSVGADFRTFLDTEEWDHTE